MPLSQCYKIMHHYAMNSLTIIIRAPKFTVQKHLHN